jgi:hypothetical protein
VGRILSVLVVIWLVIGAFAAYQRGYFTDKHSVSCHTVGDTLLTVVAGPLNYVGANPKVHCHGVPQPSK